MPKIYLEDRRREAALALSKLQHAVGGVPLLVTGIQNLFEGAEIPLAILEIGIATVVLLAFVRELLPALRRDGSGHTHHSVWGCFDLAAGVMLIFEAFHTPHHKAAYLRPQFLAGVSAIGIGLAHGRLKEFHKRRRYLEFDETGLKCRLSPLKRFNIPRNALASIDVSETQAVLHRTDGKRHTIPFARLRNSDAVREELANYVRASIGTSEG
jgi:hypothetical protein